MKLNLIIDASGIFYRSLFTIGNYGTKKDEKLLYSEDSKGIFMRKLATDFAALVKSVENVNRVIVCLDSSSWRKKIQIEDGGYKSTRKKDESSIDWNSFFELTQEFTEILGSRGYIISKIKDAEADDLLYLWSRELNSVGESVILVTGDRDLHQVVQTCENGCFTVALDPVAQRRKIYLTKETLENRKIVEPGEVDLFNPDSWNSSAGDILENLIAKNDHQIIDPVEVATKKVLLGDAGDAVPSVVTWIDKKDITKTRSMTETKLNKVLSSLPPLNWKKLKTGEFTDFFTESVNEVMKMNLESSEIQQKIDRNIQLVVLDKAVIPEEIQQNFAMLAERITSSPVHIPREQILEGTQWWSERKTIVPRSYSISFDDIEEDSPFDVKTEEPKITKGISLPKDKGGSSALF
jgi:5'-3' exonuclease